LVEFEVVLLGGFCDFIFVVGWWNSLERVGQQSARCLLGGVELGDRLDALVPSETACLASSPGRMSLTAVWISGGDGGPLVVGSQLGGLVGDPEFFQSHAFKFIPRILLLSSAK